MNDPLTDRIAALHGWQGPVTCTPLTGGITNQNFVVEDGPNRFVARICEGRRFLGIDRRNESLCQMAAHHAGLAPCVIQFEDEILISEFINARTFDNSCVQEHQTCQRLAATLRQLHESHDRLTGQLLYFCPFQTVRTYVETARQLGADLPSSIGHLIEDAGSLQRQMSPFRPTLCHNDLLAANIMDDGQQLWIVDWEYAGVGNPLFDLASVSANCDLPPELESTMLDAYFGQYDPRVSHELQILKTVSLLREALWAVIQTVKSQIDFDYGAYAAENFETYERERSRLS